MAAQLYNALKGDLVDELLAKYINLTNCPVPIKRLGNGYYFVWYKFKHLYYLMKSQRGVYGTKKIFAKIMNGNLVIRVGGGFMVIEEFIATYADVEAKKMLALDRGDHVEDMSTGKSKPYNSQYSKSPRGGGSPRAEGQLSRKGSGALK